MGKPKNVRKRKKYEKNEINEKVQKEQNSTKRTKTRKSRLTTLKSGKNKNLQLSLKQLKPVFTKSIVCFLCAKERRKRENYR